MLSAVSLLLRLRNKIHPVLADVLLSEHMTVDHYNEGGFSTAISPVCFTTYDSFGPTSVTGRVVGTNNTAVFYTGTALYPAWHITWEASDISTLSPQPPTLTSSMRVPVWTPGMTLAPGDYDDNGRGKGPSTSGRGLDGSLFWFLIVGLPVILVVFVGGGVFWCCRRMRRDKVLGFNEGVKFHPPRQKEQDDILLKERTALR
jgi:hypothetical protein